MSVHVPGPSAGGEGRPRSLGGKSGMRSVEEVRNVVLEAMPTLAPIELHLQEAHGCVLADDAVADGDVPSFSSSRTQGFAVRASDLARASSGNPVTLRVVGHVAVGRPPEVTVGGGEAASIPAGAPVPAGADCVAPIGDCLVEDDAVHVSRSFEEGSFIRAKGQLVRAGRLLVPRGRRLSGLEVGALASSGRTSVPVRPRPRVVIFATGDDLVEPVRPTTLGTIRDGNSLTLYGAVREAGAVPYLGGVVPDDAEDLKNAVLSMAARADCFISTGRVSVGERDVLKKAFFRRAQIGFYQVAMQPAMLQAFGFVEDTPYFGLPGDPLSVIVSFEVFVRPALLSMMGRRDLFRPQVDAILETDITGARDRVQFAPVKVWRDRGWRAARTGSPGSGRLERMLKANGIAVVPPGIETAHAGSRAPVMLFRPLEER